MLHFKALSYLLKIFEFSKSEIFLLPDVGWYLKAAYVSYSNPQLLYYLNVKTQINRISSEHMISKMMRSGIRI